MEGLFTISFIVFLFWAFGPWKLLQALLWLISMIGDGNRRDWVYRHELSFEDDDSWCDGDGRHIID